MARGTELRVKMWYQASCQLVARGWGRLSGLLKCSILRGLLIGFLFCFAVMFGYGEGLDCESV